MFKFIYKFLPILLIWGIFILVILTVPYPDNLTQTNSIQLISFFLPLFLAVSLNINLFLRNILTSSSIALGLIFLLTLQALDSLNLVTGSLIVVTIGLLISYFRKNKRKGLTKLPKIRKLTHLAGRKHE